MIVGCEQFPEESEWFMLETVSPNDRNLTVRLSVQKERSLLSSKRILSIAGEMDGINDTEVPSTGTTQQRASVVIPCALDELIPFWHPPQPGEQFPEEPD